MSASVPTAILLLPDETQLVKRIDFTLITNTIRPGFHQALGESCAAAVPLARSLLARGAIPDVRLAYFTDPDRNIGLKRSRQQVFEDNGARGDEMFGHGHFLPYLRYFIFGPDLPQTTMVGFCAIANDGLLTTAMQLDQLCGYVRQDVRQRHPDRKLAAEEFYKLALECDLGDHLARSVRDAALKAR
jgi:hypothetical protein